MATKKNSKERKVITLIVVHMKNVNNVNKQLKGELKEKTVITNSGSYEKTNGKKQLKGELKRENNNNMHSGTHEKYNKWQEKRVQGENSKLIT